MHGESRVSYEFRINERSERGASTAHRIRAKLRNFYFKDNACFEDRSCCFDIQPFVEMDVVLMPNVLQLVTRSEASDNQLKYCDLCSGDLWATYHLIRNCHLSELFSFARPEFKESVLEERVRALERQNADLQQRNALLKARVAKLEEEHAPRKRQKGVTVMGQGGLGDAVTALSK